jgi:hypothetical protein
MTQILTPPPFAQTIEIVATRCSACGVNFGLERTYYDKRREDHKFFHCPNGCEIHYTGATEADRLRAQLKQTENCLGYARQDVDRLRGTVKVRDRQIAARKGIITRMKRRIVAGRCVCCSHSFKDLERHMQRRHPGFDPERAAEIIASKPEQPAS